MAADPSLVKYLKEQADAGFGKEEIYQALLNAGWQKEEINEAIYEVMGKSPKKPSQTAQKAKPEQKAPSKSHSIRNALAIMVVIFALIGALFIYLFYYS
jgi:uncharacterized protein Smg (DUF494 family)